MSGSKNSKTDRTKWWNRLSVGMDKFTWYDHQKIDRNDPGSGNLDKETVTKVAWLKFTWKF